MHLTISWLTKSKPKTSTFSLTLLPLYFNMDSKMILLFSLLLWSSESFPLFADFKESISTPGVDTPKASSLHGVRVHPFGKLEGEENLPLQNPKKSVPLRSSRQLRSSQSSGYKIFNVQDYGAKGGGEDDTLAFGKAWNAACSSSTPASLVVPNGKTYLLKPITFSGPCKSTVQVMIKGNIEASSDPSDWEGKNQRIWILFSSLNNLQVGGGGTINGNGRVWWQKSCKVDKSQPCKDAPTALTFTSCSGLTVNNLIVKDSQQIHVEFENCDNVVTSSLTISSPQNSPNTDGIHVTGTTNINITNCNIATGDDCISIVTGSHTVRANGITCGPGHGISIGSLGEDGSNDQVSDVIVDTATLSGTSNGVRIKTWQGGNGYANSIIFKNIKMNNVENPIIIDQSYCDSNKPCKQQRSAVKISNVQYKNIKGTSASRNAINFNCSKNVPCSDILLQDINLVEEDGEAKSFCSNVVKLSKQGDVFPSPCN